MASIRRWPPPRLAALALATILGLGLAGCDRAEGLFFHPDAHVYRTPADDGLTFETVGFASLDGTQLSGWFIPASTRAPALGTVIQFHGNAQNMTSHYTLVAWLPRAGFNVFVFDYRGYGTSAGTPTIAGVAEDSIAALECVRARPDVDPRRIIVLGQSLGGANAILALAARPEPRVAGVVIDSAFSSFKQVARDHGGSLGGWLIDAEVDPVSVVGKISPAPMVFMHGDADRVVSSRHSQQLLDAAGEPKELWTIEGGGHLDALASRGRVYAPRLLETFRTWVAAASDQPRTHD